MRCSPSRSAVVCTLALVLGACGGSTARYSMSPYPRAESAYASGSTSVASADSASSRMTAQSAPMAAMPSRARPGYAAAHVPPAATPPTTGGSNPRGGEPQSTTRAGEEAAPMLIYTASVSMTVERPTESIDQAVELVTGAGGFLAQRNDTTVTLRVPSAHFREMLTRLERLGDVTHREVQAEDVSEQFHDLEVQLTNLRSVRARLQEFLARTTNVAEALVVEHELERVGGQIDGIEGRLRFLAARAAFSTVTLYVTRRVTAVIESVPVPTNDVAMPFAWLDQIGVPHLLQLR